MQKNHRSPVTSTMLVLPCVLHVYHRHRDYCITECSVIIDLKMEILQKLWYAYSRYSMLQPGLICCPSEPSACLPPLPSKTLPVHAASASRSACSAQHSPSAAAAPRSLLNRSAPAARADACICADETACVRVHHQYTGGMYCTDLLTDTAARKQSGS